MNKKQGVLLSRRQFGRRAAVATAGAALVPATALLSDANAGDIANQAQSPTGLSPEGQLEADSRYQQIIGLYGSRLDESQKTDLKKMCADLQPTLERVRKFSLENGNAPALYLKPLVERDKKPAGTSKKS
ncbi:MAG TPA: hypothetical protein VMH89_03880 [Candidatus Acidoferrum sp.]|nr:hypothetical protein [Candidatus Acidoferrum sp.]